MALLSIFSFIVRKNPNPYLAMKYLYPSGHVFHPGVMTSSVDFRAQVTATLEWLEREWDFLSNMTSLSKNYTLITFEFTYTATGRTTETQTYEVVYNSSDYSFSWGPHRFKVQRFGSYWITPLYFILNRIAEDFNYYIDEALIYDSNQDFVYLPAQIEFSTFVVSYY